MLQIEIKAGFFNKDGQNAQIIAKYINQDKQSSKKRKRSSAIQKSSNNTQQTKTTPLTSYDYNYYHQLYLQKYYDVNQEELSHYFPSEHVVQEMLNFYLSQLPCL